MTQDRVELGHKGPLDVWDYHGGTTKSFTLFREVDQALEHEGAEIIAAIHLEELDDTSSTAQFSEVGVR